MIGSPYLSLKALKMIAADGGYTSSMKGVSAKVNNSLRGEEEGNEELSDDNLSLFSHSFARAVDSEHADGSNVWVPINDAPFLAEVFCNKVEDYHSVQLMGYSTAAQHFMQWLDDSRGYSDQLE